MIRPEPGSFRELIDELLVERFGPTGHAEKPVDTPAQTAARRRVLLEMPADETPAVSGGAQVLPFPVAGERAA